MLQHFRSYLDSNTVKNGSENYKVGGGSGGNSCDVEMKDEYSIP